MDTIHEPRSPHGPAPFAGRRVLGVFGWVAALLFGALSILLWSRSLRAGTEIQRQDLAVQALNETLSTLKDMEAGQRGYLLTRQDAYLGPYRGGQQQVRGQLDRLEGLLRDEGLATPEERGSLEILASTKLQELDHGLELARQGHQDQVLAQLQNGSGKEATDRIRDLTGRLTARALAARQAMQLRSRRVSGQLLAAMLGFAVLTALLLAGLRAEARILGPNPDPGAPAPDPPGSVAITRDSGERRQLKQDLVATQARLRSSEERSRLMVESAVDYAILMLDPEGRVMSWNPGAERIKGYCAEEILGESFTRFYPPEAIAAGRPKAVLEAAARDGRVQEQGWRLRKDGSRFWADVAINALRDEHGALRGFGKVTRDLTERRRAEEELERNERRFHLLADHAPVGIYQLELESGLCFLNAELCRQAGLPPGSTREELRSRLHPEDHARTMESFGRALEGGETFDGEYRYLLPDGRSVWVHGKGMPVKDREGRIANFIIISEDITRRRAAEAAAQNLNRELLAANQELEAFAYSVSHDLRAPLRHIDGFVGLLKGSLGEAPDPKSRRYLEIISTSAKQMGALIDDLLAFSRMGRAEVNKVHFDLGSLMSQVVEELAPEAAGRQVQWRFGKLPVIHGDPALIRLALLNLLGNALKFTRHADPALIEVSTERQAEELVVTVRDNGAGFDMTYASKLFGVFQRLHRQDEFEGTGIGLANVARIAQKHGGRVYAEGAVGKGAAFHLAFPHPHGA